MATSTAKTPDEYIASLPPDRREAMEAFVAYALSHPEVRIVTPQNLLEWMRNPVALASD